MSNFRFLASVVVILIIMYAVFYLSFGRSLPSDEDLLSQFRDGRAEYEEFVERIRVATQRGEPLNDFKAPYLESLGIEYLCVQRYQSNEEAMTAFNMSVGNQSCLGSVGGFGVHFLTARRGIGVGTYGAGIAWLDNTPELYAGMDALTAAAKGVEGFLGFSHIEGNWYIYLWEAD